MPTTKSDRNDLKSRYPVLIEIGLIAALVFVIAAFSIRYEHESTFEIPREDLTALQIEDIPTTAIEKPKPPPPRPQPPVELPDDPDLDLEPIDIGDPIKTTEPLAIPQPPEPADEDSIYIFVPVEDQPELIGGLAALQKLIEYPEMAVKAGIEGTVRLQFVVDKDGSVVDPIVVRGIGGGCDEEALRAIRQAKFKPGMQRGKPVKVKFSLPVRFKLR